MDSNRLTAIEKSILNKLIDAHERRSPKTNRRVIIKAQNFSCYDLNDLDRKSLFIQAVKSLHQKGYVEFTWDKYEVDNLLNQIILKDETVPEIYSALKRMSKSESRDLYMAELGEYRDMIKTAWIGDFLAKEAVHISDKSRWSSIWPDNSHERREMVKLLAYLEEDQSLPMRYLSVRLFGDSKRIEKMYKGKIVAIAKRHIPLELEDEEVLEYLGIGLNPSEILFCGHLEYVLNGELLNTNGDIYGTSLNRSTVEHMENLKVYNTRVLTIENKATYYEYIKVRPDDQLVVYLGGFFGSAAKAFLIKLKENQGLSFYHWSDIDLGGFRIYRYLMNVLDRQVKPVGMDVKTYGRYLGTIAEADELPDRHLDEIRALMEFPEMSLLKDVMGEVLVRKRRLEQECIDVMEVAGR